MHSSPSSVRVFTVDPAYRRLWMRRATISLATGAGLVAIGAALFAAHVKSFAPAAVVLGAAALLFGVLVRVGGSATRRMEYRLEVGPEKLTVVWRDQVTHLPWTGLEYAKVSWNGSASTDLEARLRPDFHPELPRNASPRPSRRTPGLLHLFSLSMLGSTQADCVAEVARYIEIR